MTQDQRTLTDADVQAIAAALEARFTSRFAQKAGLGLLNLAWKGLLYALAALAVYGYMHGGSR
ncbi:MAG: hypothetical protein ACTHMO_03815 [Rhodanobacteraceae bacterium]